MVSTVLWGQQADEQNPFELVFRLDKPGMEKKVKPEDVSPAREITPSGAAQEPVETTAVPSEGEGEAIPGKDTVSEQMTEERSPVLSPAPEKEAVAPDRDRKEQDSRLKELIPPLETEKPLEQSRTALFVFFVIQLILLTFAVSIERAEVNRLLRAMANDNYLNLVHRDLKGRFPLQYFVFYLIFISQLSLFLWLCFQHGFLGDSRLSFWTCLGIISSIYLIRHMTMNSIAYVFPVQREAGQFNFTIAVFNMLLGLFLLPVNAFVAFAAPTVAVFCIYAGFVLIGGFYMLRQLKGLFIASEYVMFHRFHFFLYLCTVEIAPVVIILKFFLML